MENGGATGPGQISAARAIGLSGIAAAAAFSPASSSLLASSSCSSWVAWRLACAPCLPEASSWERRCDAGAVRDATLALNPNLAYMETERRGWLCMTFTGKDCTGEWHLLDGVRSADYRVTVDKRLRVQAGKVAVRVLPSPVSISATMPLSKTAPPTS